MDSTDPVPELTRTFSNASQRSQRSGGGTPDQQQQQKPTTPAPSPVPPAGPWQRTAKAQADRGRYLLAHPEELADVDFFVGGQLGPAENIKAHKFMLAIGSAVFEKMFYGHFKESHQHMGSGDNDGGALPVIPVPDVEPSAFRMILKYLYTDDTSGLTGDNVLTTLHAAKKYDLPVLNDACVAALKKVITPDTSVTMLVQAVFFDEEPLIQYCLEIIDATLGLVVQSDAWLNINQLTLGQIVQRDTLKIKESDLYKAVEKWAMHQCELKSIEPTGANLRDALGPVLQMIRFPLMSQQDIADGPLESGLLSVEEIAQLFAYFNKTTKPNLPFITRERVCKKQEIVAARFHTTSARNCWSHRVGNSDCIGFTVDTPASLLGIGLFGDDARKPYSGNIRIFDESEKLGPVRREEYSFMTENGKVVNRVTFATPMPLKIGVHYLICVRTRGDPSPQGESGREQLIIPLEPGSGSHGRKITVKFEEEEDPEASKQKDNGQQQPQFFNSRYKTGIKGGQIPELYLTVDA